MFVAIERRSMATAIFSFDGRRAKQRWWPRVGFNTLPNLDFRGFSALRCTECTELSLIQCPLVRLTHCDDVTYNSRPSPHTRHRSELPTKRACHALVRIAASWAAFPNKSHLSTLHAVHDCPLLSDSTAVSPGRTLPSFGSTVPSATTGCLRILPAI